MLRQEYDESFDKAALNALDNIHQPAQDLENTLNQLYQHWADWGVDADILESLQEDIASLKATNERLASFYIALEASQP